FRLVGSRRDVPGGGKSPKMVEPDHVDICQQRAEPLNAPPVPCGSDGAPVIDRIPPELSQRAEIIGRYSGNEAWPVSFIELEQSRIGPHVARIPANVERQIADQAQAFAVRILLEMIALPVQQELRKAHLGDRLGEFLSSGAESDTTALDQLRRPFEIMDALAFRLERSEERIVVQPVGLALAKLIENVPQVGASASSEIAPGGLEKPALESRDHRIIDSRRRECTADAIVRAQQPVLDQIVRTDQQLVSTKRRKRLIRGVAVPRRAKRERLPPALASIGQPVDPGPSAEAKITDAVARRQGGDVQQYARRPVFGWKRRRRSAAILHHARPLSIAGAPEPETAAFTMLRASRTIVSRCASSLKLSA